MLMLLLLLGSSSSSGAHEEDDGSVHIFGRVKAAEKLRPTSLLLLHALNDV